MSAPRSGLGLGLGPGPGRGGGLPGRALDPHFRPCCPAGVGEAEPGAPRALRRAGAAEEMQLQPLSAGLGPGGLLVAAQPSPRAPDKCVLGRFVPSKAGSRPAALHRLGFPVVRLGWFLMLPCPVQLYCERAHGCSLRSLTIMHVEIKACLAGVGHVFYRKTLPQEP